MVIRKYPEEIQKAMETYKPYAKCIHDGELEGSAGSYRSV